MIGAVITAAGVDEDKELATPLLKLGSISVVQRVIQSFQQAYVDKIVVVTGNQGSQIEKSLSGSGVIFIRNENYENTDMFQSACLGLDFLKECTRVFLTPVDVPFFSAETLNKLLAVESLVSIPYTKERSGHPILLDNSILTKILDYKGNDGMRGAIKSLDIQVTKIEVSDEGILVDIEKTNDYEVHLHKHTDQLMRYVMDLQIAREKVFLNNLDIQFLEVIQQTASVKIACDHLKISYSLGWKKLKLMEENIGKPVVHTVRGGVGGGYSELSEVGESLLKRYRNFEKEIKTYADERFQAEFSEFFW